MQNLLKESNVRTAPEKTLVCKGCKDTLDITVKHDENIPDYKQCKFCMRIKWCCTYLI